MINIKTIPLFSIPLSIVNFGKDSEELNSRLISDIIEENTINSATEERSAINGWQSHAYMEKKYESFSILAQSVETVIYNLLEKYGFDSSLDYENLFCCNMFWTNILNIKSSYHMPHIHGTGQTLFSGVYYPTSGLTDDFKDYYENEDYEDVDLRASSVPESGDLVLFDPAANEKRQVIPHYVKRFPYYGSEICIRPKHSHLIIFPNYLMHMVAPISLDNFNRLSISFNFGKK